MTHGTYTIYYVDMLMMGKGTSARGPSVDLYGNFNFDGAAGAAEIGGVPAALHRKRSTRLETIARLSAAAAWMQTRGQPSQRRGAAGDLPGD